MIDEDTNKQIDCDCDPALGFLTFLFVLPLCLYHCTIDSLVSHKRNQDTTITSPHQNLQSKLHFHSKRFSPLLFASTDIKTMPYSIDTPKNVKYFLSFYSGEMFFLKASDVHIIFKDFLILNVAYCISHIERQANNTCITSQLV